MAARSRSRGSLGGPQAWLAVLGKRPQGWAPRRGLVRLGIGVGASAPSAGPALKPPEAAAFPGGPGGWEEQRCGCRCPRGASLGHLYF